MNRIEKWRRDREMTQRQVAQHIQSTDYVIVRAEKGLPIRQRYQLALIALSDGFLKARDFKTAEVDRKRRD